MLVMDWILITEEGNLVCNQYHCSKWLMVVIAASNCPSKSCAWHDSARAVHLPEMSSVENLLSRQGKLFFTRNVFVLLHYCVFSTICRGHEIKCDTKYYICTTERSINLRLTVYLRLIVWLCVNTLAWGPLARASGLSHGRREKSLQGRVVLNCVEMYVIDFWLT